MQARRYAVANIRSVSRNWEDLPPLASDEELVEWGKELIAPKSRTRTGRPNRPLVATRTTAKLSTEELLLDISDRATEVYARRTRVRITARR
jgi:hypothetical protein